MPTTIQRSFTSGEIAPSLRSRADLTKYATGLAKCENFFIRAQGGAYSRPGFRYIGNLGNMNRKGRLIPFSFNTIQTYVLVFEHLKMRVIKNGGFVLNGLGPALYEIATPYTENQLSRIGYTQNADVMTLVHPDHDVRNLSRLADDNWTLSLVNYASLTTIPVITAAAIGNPDGGGDYPKTYTYVVTAVVDGKESLQSLPVSVTCVSLSVTFGIRVEWAAVANAEYYRVYKDLSLNTDVYGWVGNSTTLSFDDYNIAPISSDAPPVSREPFTGIDNKPSAVTYYQQRQILANTHNEPQTVFATQVGQFDSVRTSNPARDDDAITFTIAARQVNEIRHMVSLNSLILLTSGGEWKVTEGQDQVLTPSTVGVRIQSYNGSSWVPPVIVNDTVLYLQEKSARIRDLGYEFSSDKYTGSDLSLMSEHLFENYQITDMTFSAEPYSILWCVRSDGVLLGLTYQREQQVYGWHIHTTQGQFESVTTISENGRDTVYAIVKRMVNGNVVRYVERMENRNITNAADAFCVDSGLSYIGGGAVTTVSGLGHLEGKTVTVLADGYTLPDEVVTGGSITLPRAATKIHVGLSYLPVIETLDIDVGSPVETLKAQSKSVNRVVLEVEGSRGGWVGGITDIGTYDMYEIKPRFDIDGYDAILLKTYKQEVFIQPGWNKGGGVRIEQRNPLPLAILSAIPRFDTGD